MSQEQERIERVAEHHLCWLNDIQKETYVLFSDDPATDCAVLFVHGFMGDAEGTWVSFQEMIRSTFGRYWKDWLKCDTYFYSYRSFRDDITYNAEHFLKFCRAVFPAPPRSLFGTPVVGPKIERVPADYKQLILVGHSEGGVIIRRALDIAYNRGLKDILNARLALFAPAQAGVKLSGWIGACMAVGRVGALLMPMLRYSRAFNEMDQGTVLREIENHTKSYRDQELESGRPAPPAFRAHVLYGREENVVTKGFYSWDCLHDDAEERDHISICKPGAHYDRPLKFVIDRVRGVDECTDLTNS